ncbi:MAG: putative glycoside hydrolase [Thermoleophilaceae bacterium]
MRSGLLTALACAALVGGTAATASADLPGRLPGSPPVVRGLTPGTTYREQAPLPPDDGSLPFGADSFDSVYPGALHRFYYAIGSNELVGASDAQLAATARRNALIVLPPWKDAIAAKLKAANPALRVLVYKETFVSTETDPATGKSVSGVPWADAQPSWLLRGRDGQPLASSNVPYYYFADVGDPAYQDAWASNVLRELGARGSPWDGVFIDDFLPTTYYHTNGDVSQVAKYPSDAAWQPAMESFGARIGPRIQAAGKLVVANMGGTWADPRYADWNTSVVLGFLSGGLDEFFMHWWGSDQPQDASYFDTVQRIGQRLERAGKLFLAQTTNNQEPDARASLYGYVTALLFANGHSGFSYAADPSYDVGQSWLPLYGMPVGSALGPAAPVYDQSQPGPPAWLRRFSRVVAIANPGDSPKTVAFDASEYCPASSGSTVTGHTTVGPRAGALLDPTAFC